MNIRSTLAFGISLAFANLLLMPVTHAAQIVAPQTQNALFVSADQDIANSVRYSVSAPDTNNSVGLGLRVHFDSSKLSFNSLTNALQNGFQPISNIQDDSSDFDGDPQTDKFFIVAWVDTTGQWPASTPIDLFTSHFTANTGFVDSTRIAFTASATAADTEFLATPQIICSKPSVSLSSNSSEILEGSAANIAVTLDHSLPAECLPLSVNISVAGTATVGNDYQTPNTELIFTDNSTSKSLTLTTVDDTDIEDIETLEVGIVAGNNYDTPAQTNSLSLNLISNDSGVSIAIDQPSVVEAATTNTRIVTVTRTGYLDSALDVAYQVAGTATAGQDFTLDNSSNVLHFAAGQAVASITINILDDTVAENSENITISLANSSSYQILQNSEVMLTIEDNDDMCMDIDGNGEVTTLSDGIMLTRYLLGYRGNNLVDNNLGNNATRSTASSIVSYIESHISTGCYDVDGNGSLNALTDGVLLMRYLSDLQGDALTTDAIGAGATRTNSASIQNYLSSIIIH